MNEFGKIVGQPVIGDVTITAEQRAAFLQTIADNKDTLIGNIAAARAAGIQGTRKQIHDMIERENLKEEIFEARGRNVEKVKQTLYEIACDTEHPGVMRAISLFLKAYGGEEFRDISRHEVTGARGGPVHLLAGQFNLDQVPVEKLEQLKEILALAAADPSDSAPDDDG